MRGYEVVTSDDRRVGTVKDVVRGYLIVEIGRFRRSRRPVPREFTHTVDEAGKVFVTVPRSFLREAPRVGRNGEFEDAQVARHYGLVSSYPEEGSRAPSEHRRAEIRKHMRPGLPEELSTPSSALPETRIEESRIRE